MAKIQIAAITVDFVRLINIGPPEVVKRRAPAQRLSPNADIAANSSI
jgi:hypothetical protein